VLSALADLESTAAAAEDSAAAAYSTSATAAALEALLKCSLCIQYWLMGYLLDCQAHTMYWLHVMPLFNSMRQQHIVCCAFGQTVILQLDQSAG